MVHIGRCGSTAVSDMLAQHPMVYWDGETYHRVYRELRSTGVDVTASGFDPAEYIAGRLSRSGRRWFGFDAKFHQFMQGGSSIEQYVSDLSHVGVTKFISLRRRNYLRKVVSSKLGRSRGWYHTREPPKEDGRKVRIDVASVHVDTVETSLLEHFQRWELRYESLERVVPADRLLCLEYEADIESNPLRAYDKIVKFLELKPWVPQVTTHRVNPQPVADLIVNFEEVRGALAGTTHEWMLAT